VSGQTNRIPTQGLKPCLNSGIMGLVLRPNKQNPDSGIETTQSHKSTCGCYDAKQTESRLRD